jgi:DNA polymerase III delta subunit
MDEFYEKNLFGESVNIGIEEPEDEADLGEREDNRFNIFQLTDAIGARDKRNAWMIYRKALASGMNAEEIFWRVMWGVKALLLASKAKSAEESGLNPFVYRKSKSFLKNWKDEELETLSKNLVEGLHESRRGVVEVETMLEKWVLTL